MAIEHANICQAAIMTIKYRYRAVGIAHSGQTIAESGAFCPAMV